MKVLLLGGTGAMGVSLAEILAENQQAVFITSRRPRKDFKSVRYIVGNAKEDAFLFSLLEREKFDVVVDFMVYTTEAFRQRVDKILGLVGQYVFLSSSRVYAQSERPITEDSPRLLDVCQDTDYLKTDEYALTKARQEDLLKASGKTNWTVIRPYITYNTERLQLGVFEKEQWLFRALAGRTIVFSRDIAQCTSTMTYGYDVAYGISRILENPKALGKAIHFVAPGAMRWSEMLKIYQKLIEELTGRCPKVKHIENTDGINRFLNPHQVKYDRLYDRLFDSTNAEEIIGESIAYMPFEQGVRKVLKEFLDKGSPFMRVNWSYEAVLDRITGECTYLGDIPGWKGKLRYLYWRYLKKSE